MRYGQDNSAFANMDMYRIENVVCYPFRTATLVDNETIEGQIGEGCRVCESITRVRPALPYQAERGHGTRAGTLSALLQYTSTSTF